MKRTIHFTLNGQRVAAEIAPHQNLVEVLQQRFDLFGARESCAQGLCGCCTVLVDGMLHMPDYPQEGALRGGHIPGAQSVPWARAAAEDATFRPRAELEAIYLGEAGLRPDDDVVVYCRIGERSSHTWFVLHHLLGFPHVRNYDGSWTEWGNSVRVPIRRGDSP